MLSLHTNAAALSSQNSVGSTQKSLTTSLTRLGTGFRVNSAMHDAAGLQIATRLNAQARGMSVHELMRALDQGEAVADLKQGIAQRALTLREELEPNH